MYAEYVFLSNRFFCYNLTTLALSQSIFFEAVEMSVKRG